MKTTSKDPARILLVSADDATRTILRALLASDGHEVWTARSALHAQREMEQHDLQLLIIDEAIDGAAQLEEFARCAGIEAVVNALDPLPSPEAGIPFALGPAELDRHIGALTRAGGLPAGHPARSTPS